MFVLLVYSLTVCCCCYLYFAVDVGVVVVVVVAVCCCCCCCYGGTDISPKIGFVYLANTGVADIEEGLLAIVICELVLTSWFAILITAVDGGGDDGGGDGGDGGGSGGGGGGGDGGSVDGVAACGFTFLN